MNKQDEVRPAEEVSRPLPAQSRFVEMVEDDDLLLEETIAECDTLAMWTTKQKQCGAASSEARGCATSSAHVAEDISVSKAIFESADDTAPFDVPSPPSSFPRASGLLLPLVPGSTPQPKVEIASSSRSLGSSDIGEDKQAMRSVGRVYVRPGEW